MVTDKSTPRYRGIIFDLDGTLMNTEEGVLSSVRYTTQRMGYPPLSDDVMRTFIGPPVKHSLIRCYGLNEEEATAATEVFRDHYKNYDLLKAVPYDGILALLEKLKREGYLVGVATLKRTDYALTLLEHYGIAAYCDSICGSDSANKLGKCDVLRLCLKKLGLSCEEGVLIGDTSLDGAGAAQAGTAFIGVTYGFGPSSAGDWEEFCPVFVAETPQAIGAYLDSLRRPALRD